MVHVHHGPNSKLVQVVLYTVHVEITIDLECKNIFVVCVNHENIKARNIFQITKPGNVELIPLKIFRGCPRPRKYYYTK